MKSKPATTLAANLKRALDEQGRSVRGLAIEAGLLPDAARNVLRGLSKNPAPESVSAIAQVLGISVSALYGDEPWPEAVAATQATPAKRARKRSAPRTGSMSVPEYELRPGGPAGVAAHAPVATWSMPPDFIGAHGLGGDIAIIRAPSRQADIEPGDRLLVDLATFARLPSPPGLVVLHDGVGHLLAHVSVASAGKIRVDIGHGKPVLTRVDNVDIAARVLGKWTWV